MTSSHFCDVSEARTCIIRVNYLNFIWESLRVRSNSCLAMNIDSLLSALLTGSFQNQTTASCLLADAAANETTTSSFSGDSVDNQPSSSKRKRGVNALLNDATNIKPASKRRCATKASSNISQQKSMLQEAIQVLVAVIEQRLSRSLR